MSYSTASAELYLDNRHDEMLEVKRVVKASLSDVKMRKPAVDGRADSVRRLK